MSDWFVSERMARAYATSRPPVHPKVIRLVRAESAGTRVDRALDIGCGTGLSSRALEGMAERVTGVEPSHTMLRHAAGDTAVARAEQLPFPAEVFELASAAGSLNWSDLHEVLPEIRRVLRAGGRLLVYDFGPGLLPGHAGTWHSQFAGRYPFPPARSLSPRTIPGAQHGLNPELSRDFEIILPWNRAAYLDYAMSETNVEAAIQAGASELEVRAWCRECLFDLLPEGEFPVRYQGYWALFRAVPGS